MKTDNQSYKNLIHDGIVYLDLNTLTKSELRTLNRLPFGHSTLICDDFYTKVYACNPLNPPRGGFSMVLMSDHPKFLAKQLEQKQQSSYFSQRVNEVPH